MTDVPSVAGPVLVVLLPAVAGFFIGGINPATIDMVVAALPDYTTRAAQAAYAALPQAAQIVPIDYASAWMDGLSNMYLAFGIAMAIGAVFVLLAKSHMTLPAQPQPAGE